MRLQEERVQRPGSRRWGRRRHVVALGAGGLTMLVAAVAPALVTPSGAQEASFNPVDGTQGFLVVSEGDVFLGADEAEGAVAVGGDLSFGGYNVMQGSVTFTAPGDSTPTALLVRGQVDLTASSGSLQVLDGMYTKVGDPTGVDVRSTDDNGATADTRLQPEGTPYGTTPHVALAVSQPEDSVTTPVPTSSFDFDPLFTTFRERSAGLAACPSTVQLLNRDDSSPIAGNEVISSGTPVRLGLDAGSQNVLNIDAQSLNNIGEITFDQQPTADEPLVINVDTSDVGGELDWTPPGTAGISGADAPYILWNFSGATRVTLSAAGGATVEGTIYAPDADVQHLGSYNVEGNVIAAVFEHGAPPVTGGAVSTPNPPGGGGARDVARVQEVHDRPFDAELTPCEDVPPRTTTSSSTSSSTVPPSTTSSSTTSSSTVPSSTTSSSTVPTPPDSTTTTTVVPAASDGDDDDDDSGGLLPRTGSPLIGTAAVLGLGMLAAGSVAVGVARGIRS